MPPDSPRIPLEELTRDFFSPPVRARGDRYRREGRVTLTRSDSALLEGVVRGTLDYRVALLVDAKGGLRASCGCPAFADAGPCKHIWAAVLEADRRGSPFASEMRGPPEPAWRRAIRAVAARVGDVRAPVPGPLAAPEVRTRFLLLVDESSGQGGCVLRIEQQRRLRSGAWGAARAVRGGSAAAAGATDPSDTILIENLLRSRTASYAPVVRDGIVLDRALAALFLPLLCRTGRLYWIRDGQESASPLCLDEGIPWRFALELKRTKKASRLEGLFVRGGERLPLPETVLVAAPDFLVTATAVARFGPPSAMAWLTETLRTGTIEAPREEEPALVEALLAQPEPPLLLHPERRLVTDAAPRPVLSLRAEEEGALPAEISFDYGDAIAPLLDRRSLLDHPAGGAIVARNLGEERRLAGRFLAAGGTLRGRGEEGAEASVPTGLLAGLVPALLGEGWRVEASGKRFRPAGAVRWSVSSGTDWFDLEGKIEFGETEAALPAILDAARRKSPMVVLGDGSIGLLPEGWLEKWSPWLAAGQGEGARLRFGRNQSWILDALLAAHPDSSADARFRGLRERLRGAGDLRPEREGAEFRGELRDYQRDALGWFRFLRELGFGGCLADDMGLGKTVQVLALLEARRKEAPDAPPSLVVAPRSLTFNWIEEAARFAPSLRVGDYTGPERKRLCGAEAPLDLLVTTYGTLRQDILHLRERRFDYVILDEAQAIKNPSSQSAKSARLLPAEHRLALTGTPIENRLSDFGSIMEFLNPGFLGRSKALSPLSSQGDEAAARALIPALRPFLLRRTKEQVLRSLPAKVEQTLHCDMGEEQARCYRQIRDFHRASLLRRVDDQGMARSRMHVLEALLRLRQAACHPGLLDPARADADSAKLDVLLPLLEETIAEGHKALVFSQFTSMLDLLRRSLDASKIRYEYLDGRTARRDEVVGRFQSPGGAPLFLISLKAGGFGLNLTAADYVFLLDPWWNPAVEQQAVDRTHRIGQTRPVFAYRLVCRDTIEERILDLQRRKRAIADSILEAQAGGLRSLTRADLELLLS